MAFFWTINDPPGLQRLRERTLQNHEYFNAVKMESTQVIISYFNQTLLNCSSMGKLITKVKHLCKHRCTRKFIKCSEFDFHIYETRK